MFGAPRFATRDDLDGVARAALVAGPLRLLDGDFPDRDCMKKIAEHSLRQALTYL